MTTAGPDRARQNFQREISQPEARLDLARAALYVAQEAYPDLEVEPCLARLDEIASEIAPRLPPERYPLRIVRAINQGLFESWGFRGNTDSYYDPRNSFLNEVLRRRTGIPISLSLVYVEVARRLQFPVVGIGMPGHFLIRPDLPEIEFFIDPFNGGEILFVADCEARLRSLFSEPTAALQPEFLAPISKRAWLTRLLANLKFIYIQTDRPLLALGVLDRLLLLNPEAALERRDRGLVAFQLGRRESAARDLEVYLAARPQAPDAPAIRDLLGRL